MSPLPRRNRIDPLGDLHAVPDRGMFTGNRGCLVNDDRELVRHHNGTLWIICQTSYRDWSHPLDQPRTWTPLFFLDDAVALAAGHRPCGLCRRQDHLAYQRGVTVGDGADKPVLAGELNRRLAAERLVRGRGLERAADRRVWSTNLDTLPTGTVVLSQASAATADSVGPDVPHLVTGGALQPFTFGGWGSPTDRPVDQMIEVITPPTSVSALTNGFAPTLHGTAAT